MGTSLVGRIVAVSIRHSLIVLLAALAATAAALVYLAQNFAMTAETGQLISPKLEWRKRGIAFDKAFPQLQNLTMIVVDGATPELADDGAKRLASALQQRPDLFHNVRQPDGGRFFERNGLLLLPMDDVRSVTDALIKVQPLLSALAADPSLAGAMKMLNVTLLGIDSGDVKLKDIEPQLKALAGTFEKAVAGQPAYFSWRTLVTGDAPDLGDKRRLILAQPELDYGQLQPGQGASDAIRAMARSLNLDPAHGVTVRLTGQVPLADEEFGSLADDAGLITVTMATALIGILWLAVRSTRITTAILCTTLIGLVITAAIGLLAVGRFNLISVAFIPLFVGLGVDFSIQFSVRALAERLVRPNLETALVATGTAIGKALALSAAAIGVGFFAFLPTSYLGVAELGTIAGLGMMVAFTLTIVLLPTVLILLRAPQAGMKEVGFTMLAPVDDLVHRHRRAVLVVALLAAIAAAALLPLLRFDYNPLNLKSPRVESMATLHDMQHDRNWSLDAINILAPSLADAVPLARRLADLPEVSRVVSLNSFMPENQKEKLVLIGDAVDVVEPVLDVEPAQPATDSELQQRLGATAVSLRQAAEHSPERRRRLGASSGRRARSSESRHAGSSRRRGGGRGDAAQDHARPGASRVEGPPDLHRDPAQRAHCRLDRRGWACPAAGPAEGRQRRRIASAVRAGGPVRCAGCDRLADIHRRIGREHRPCLPAGGNLLVRGHYAAAGRRAASGARRRAHHAARHVERPSDVRHLRGPRPAAEFHQHHCLAAAVRRRRRLQHLLRARLARRRDGHAAIEPHARRGVQRHDDGDRLWRALAVEPSRHRQHGPTADDLVGLGAARHPAVPAGAAGAAVDPDDRGNGLEVTDSHGLPVRRSALRPGRRDCGCRKRNPPAWSSSC